MIIDSKLFRKNPNINSDISLTGEGFCGGNISVYPFDKFLKGEVAVFTYVEEK